MIVILFVGDELRAINELNFARYKNEIHHCERSKYLLDNFNITRNYLEEINKRKAKRIVEYQCIF